MYCGKKLTIYTNKIEFYLNFESKNFIKAYTKRIKVMVCNPMATSGKFFSINFAILPIPTQIKTNTIGDAVFIKVMIFFIFFYLKKLSTNSYLLKTCKSSKPSPTPMYFTGI